MKDLREKLKDQHSTSDKNQAGIFEEIKGLKKEGNRCLTKLDELEKQGQETKEWRETSDKTQAGMVKEIQGVRKGGILCLAKTEELQEQNTELQKSVNQGIKQQEDCCESIKGKLDTFENQKNDLAKRPPFDNALKAISGTGVVTFAKTVTGNIVATIFISLTFGVLGGVIYAVLDCYAIKMEKRKAEGKQYIVISILISIVKCAFSCCIPSAYILCFIHSRISDKRLLP